MSDDEQQSLREYVLERHPELRGKDERLIHSVERIMVTMGDVPQHLKRHSIYGWREHLEREQRLGTIKTQIEITGKKAKRKKKNDEPGTTGVEKRP